MTSPVSSCLVEEEVYEKEKGGISSDDDDGMRYIYPDDEHLRGYIRVNDGRHRSRSNLTSYFTLEIMEKLLVVMGELDIGARPATITSITQVTMVDFLVYLNLKDEIVVGMVQGVEVGLKISSTLTFIMLEKVLMVMGEVDIGLRPALIYSIIQTILVYHWVL